MRSARGYPAFLGADRICADYPGLGTADGGPGLLRGGSGHGTPTRRPACEAGIQGIERALARCRRRCGEGGEGTVSTTEDTGGPWRSSRPAGPGWPRGRRGLRLIVIDPAICTSCPHHACVAACPAQLFTRDEEGAMHFDHAGCLECGTCRVVCTPGGIVRWTYPHSGFGITYRAFRAPGNVLHPSTTNGDGGSGASTRERHHEHVVHERRAGGRARHGPRVRPHGGCTQGPGDRPRGPVSGWSCSSARANSACSASRSPRPTALGMDQTTNALVLEEIAKVSPVLTIAMGAHILLAGASSRCWAPPSRRRSGWRRQPPA